MRCRGPPAPPLAAGPFQATELWRRTVHEQSNPNTHHAHHTFTSTRLASPQDGLGQWTSGRGSDGTKRSCDACRATHHVDRVATGGALRALAALALLSLVVTGVLEVLRVQRYQGDILGLHDRRSTVRRELRQLSPARLDRFVSAMWTLRRVAGHEGRAKYGPGYLSYDEFVAQHWSDVSLLKCADETTHQGENTTTGTRRRRGGGGRGAGVGYIAAAAAPVSADTTATWHALRHLQPPPRPPPRLLILLTATTAGTTAPSAATNTIMRHALWHLPPPTATRVRDGVDPRGGAWCRGALLGRGTGHHCEWDAGRGKCRRQRQRGRDARCRAQSSVVGGVAGNVLVGDVSRECIGCI